MSFDLLYLIFSFLATSFAVLGINCIKPSAPVLDFAALKNSLSCLITDKTSDLSTFWSNAKSLLVGNNSLCRGVPFSVDFFATVSEPFINPAS